jgi:hypothetical protein
MEILGFGAIGIGMLIALIGWIWLIVLGFQNGGALWGILNIFFQPITGIIFCIMHKTGWAALALLIIGNIIAAGGVVPVMMSNMNNMNF